MEKSPETVQSGSPLGVLANFMIETTVKLVIWDLDDTFWQGTLLEGGITAIPRNADIVRALSERGIINSICSKNDAEKAKAKLVELGIWDHFVFSSIGFHPKGQAIAGIIEGATLRPENVLFIDDNISNREEASYFNRGIMTAHPDEVLDKLLDHPHCIGKPDPKLSRLRQYRFLQKRAEERSASTLSNEEFLRASNLRISIDYDVEGNFFRVIELINRTNQLNYTKVRLDTPRKTRLFRQSLSEFGYHAGCVRAIDKYGNYGLIGFFQMRQKAKDQRLIHFVFSCRTMNMGIEQYIYRELGKPEIKIVEPVSYGLESDVEIDWINASTGVGAPELKTTQRKLLLLGGCDLLQLASYCSSNTAEFVNSERDWKKVRYDDPGFVLADREAVRTSQTLPEVPTWTYDDTVHFDAELAEAEIAIISLWTGTSGEYYELENGLRIRLGKRQAERLRKMDRRWFDTHMHVLELTDEARLQLIVESLEKIGSTSKTGCRIFVLGCHTAGAMNPARAKLRQEYNEVTRNFCARNSDQFRYVDLDGLISPEELLDNVHFSRSSYFKLAQHILNALDHWPAKAAGSHDTDHLLAEAAE